MEYYSGEDNDEKAISASQIKTFTRCPKQYELRYREGKEATKDNDEYARLGTHVHETLETALSGSETTLSNEDVLRQSLLNIYRERNIDLSDRLYKRGKNCLQTAAKYIAQKEPDIQGIEEKVEFLLDTGDVETEAVAKVDVFADGEIWDWKTGKIKDNTAHDEKIQGAVYMAAYYQQFGEPPEAIRFIYLSDHASDAGSKVRKIDPSDDTWNYMITEAKRLLHAKDDDSFPGRPEETSCYWCEYEGFCDVSPVGYGNVEINDVMGLDKFAYLKEEV